MAADDIGQEHFVFETADADGGGLFGECDEGASNASDHGSCPELGGLGGEAKGVIEAEGDGGRVSDVVGVREGAEFEFGLDGVLHLFFGGFAAAGEQSFDLGGGVLEEGDFGFSDGEQDDTSDVSKEE